MQPSFGFRAIVAAVTAFIAGTALAQTIPSGIYSMPDSGYSISIEPRGDDLSVIEAGKQRTYRKAGPGAYQYYSEIMGATYELRYRDRGSVSALKLGSGGGATLLFRQGGPAPEEPKPALGAAVAEKPAPPPPPGAPPASPYLAVAEKYQVLALTDKKDVQSWAFCSAAALKRSMATKAEADAYGREAAERLASISVDPDKNPCPDAIPVELWPASKSADAEALKAANGDALALAAKQREAIAAMKAKEAADRAAFERAQAEHQAALARAKAAQEAYEREQAAYKAAAAEYQRQLEATKRGGKGSN
jgi:hypothetical protein